MFRQTIGSKKRLKIDQRTNSPFALFEILTTHPQTPVYFFRKNRLQGSVPFERLLHWDAEFLLEQVFKEFDILP